MALELLFGIQTNGIRHTEADGMPDIDTRLRMVKEAGGYDYVDKTPEPNEIDEVKAASEKYDLPIRAGEWYYTIGRDELLFEKNIKTARLLGSFFHNTQILTYHDDGHPIADNEVVATYMNFSEIGDKYGVIPCFEVQVNMWSEDFRRVARVGRAIEARGAKFNMTLDHRHIIFKIDNPEEQEISNIRDDVEMGKLILDPYVEGNVVQQWTDSGWIRHCHARSTVPNNPKNFDTLSEDGKPGRGIQYPF